MLGEEGDNNSGNVSGDNEDDEKRLARGSAIGVKTGLLKISVLGGRRLPPPLYSGGGNSSSSRNMQLQYMFMNGQEGHRVHRPRGKRSHNASAR